MLVTKVAVSHPRICVSIDFPLLFTVFITQTDNNSSMDHSISACTYYISDFSLQY